MEFDYKEKTLLKLLLCSVLVSFSIVARGNSTVIVDGTLSTAYNQGTGNSHTLSTNSPTIIIDGKNDGKIQNSNLFFSFSQFNVGTGDTAQFICTSCPAVSNVISRVTGGSPSSIYGTLDSTQIPGANFWLINPVGVLFGPGSSVNVPAAFHVSNATKILDGNGVEYSANNPTDVSNLFISPATFGFTHLEQIGVLLDGVTITAGGGPNNYSRIDIEGSTITIGPFINLGQANSPATLNGSGVNVFSLGDLNISGALVLNDFGGASPGSAVTASGSLRLQGDGVNTGVIKDNSSGGGLIVTAGELDIGVAGSYGGMYKTGSSGGALSINADVMNFTANSAINDSGTGGGNLNINVNSGGLSLGVRDSITKSTPGQMNLVVSGALDNMGRLGLDTATRNTGPIVNISADSITNTGSITGSITSGRDVTNSGAITGNVTALNGNVTNNSSGIITGSVVASGGSGNIINYGQIILNTGPATQIVTAANDLIVDGSEKSGTITDNQTASAGASINAGNALILQNNGEIKNSYAEPLVLTASSLNMTSSTISSAGSVFIENPGYPVSNAGNPINLMLNKSSIDATTLDLGSPDRMGNGGAVIAGQEFILTATNQSRINVSGEFGQHSNFIINLNSNNSVFSGNPIYLQTANKNELQANANNLFEPASFNSLSLPFLQNGNLFIDATGVQISAPSNSIVSSEIIAVARPLEIPAVPSDPCATGSNLELKNSHGVLPAYTELLPFSVFYASGHANRAAALSEALDVKLASNAVKKIDCGKT